MSRSLLIWLVPVLTFSGLLMAQEPAPKAEPNKAKISEPATLPYRIVLGKRTSNIDGKKLGLAHTGGAGIEVTQPQSDTAIFSFTGVAIAAGLPLSDSNGNVVADFIQNFQLRSPPGVNVVRLRLDGQLIGQLAGNREGAGVASLTVADATITANQQVVTRFEFEPRSHSGADSLFINDKQEPIDTHVPLVDYTLQIRFRIDATHPRKHFHKNVASSIFGTDLGKPAEWLSLLTPVHEFPKQKDLGFRVGIRALAVK